MKELNSYDQLMSGEQSPVVSTSDTGRNGRPKTRESISNGRLKDIHAKCATNQTVNDKSILAANKSSKKSKSRHSKTTIKKSIKNLCKLNSSKVSSHKRNPAHKNKSRVNKNSGFITCLVCNQTKYYSHVQRRYGIFSCEPCFKFFSRFVKEPKQFFCPNKEKCLIVVECDSPSDGKEHKNLLSNCTGSRCKACWLKLCFDKFKINSDTKQTLVNKYYPQRQTDTSELASKNSADSTEHNSNFTKSDKSLIDTHLVNDTHEAQSITKSENICEPLSNKTTLPSSDDSSLQELSDCSKLVGRKLISNDHSLTKPSSKRKFSKNGIDAVKSDPLMANENSTSLTKVHKEITKDEIKCRINNISSKSITNCTQPVSGTQPTMTPSTSILKSASSMPSQSKKQSYHESCLGLTNAMPSTLMCPQQSIGESYPSQLPHFNNSFFPSSYPINIHEKETSTNSYSLSNNQCENPQNCYTHLKSKQANTLAFNTENGNESKLMKSTPDSSKVASVSEPFITQKSSSDKIYQVNKTSKRKAMVTKDSAIVLQKDSNKSVNSKKSRCKECEGCRAQDCGQCTYCLDKKKFGGQNVIKQACKFRVCIRFQNSQKPSQTTNSLTNIMPIQLSGKTQESPSHRVVASTSVKRSNRNNIQSPTFYPTPPPHSNSQHSSPKPLPMPNGQSHLGALNIRTPPANTPKPGLSPVSTSTHLSSLPTPTSSPLSQATANCPPPPPPPKLKNVANYAHYNSYMPFAEPTSIGNNTNCGESSYNSSNTYNFSSYDSNQPYGGPYCGNSLNNYYVPANNLNFNCKISSCSTKLGNLQGSLINPCQYPNEYMFGNGNYKNNCLSSYFAGDYSSQQCPRNNWHQPAYQFSNINYEHPEMANSLYSQHTHPLSNHSYNYDNYY